jgi:hypothetical protein
MICLGILTILFFPVLEMVERVNSAYSQSIRLANLRADLDRVGARVTALLRQRPYTIGADNKSATLGPSRELFWQDDSLFLVENGRKRALATGVNHFSLFRRDGLTNFALELHDPAVNKTDQKRFVVEEGGYAARL